MRIISGTARGLRLKSPRGAHVRPTADRVKESVFAVLGDLHQARVADICAGTGALGLEALSRGAAQVFFADSHPRSIRILEENLRHVLKAFPDPPTHAVQIVRADLRQLPQRFPNLKNRFHVILADPPYQPATYEAGAADLLINGSFREWAGSALLVLEHPAGAPLPWDDDSGWHCVRTQTFGATSVSYARNIDSP